MSSQNDTVRRNHKTWKFQLTFNESKNSHSNWFYSVTCYKEQNNKLTNEKATTH